MKLGSRLCRIAVVGGLLGGPGALGAQPPTAAADPFGEVLEVRLVNVEVVVTDARGDRVRGLRPDDFRLLVDGVETPIDLFTEVRAGAAAPAAASGPDAAAAMAATVPFASGEPVGTNYLIFLDDLFTLRRDRERILVGIEEELGRLRPEDRVAVVRWNGFELEMLTSWTHSRAELQRVFGRARRAPSGGLLQRGLDDLESGRAAELDSGGEAAAALGDKFSPGAGDRLYYRRLQDRLERSVAAAAATVRAFAGPDGRKVMLLVAGGWIYEPPAQMFIASGRSEVIFGGPWGRELYQPLADVANRVGYTLYPVDAAGFTAHVPIGVDGGGGELPEGTDGLGAGILGGGPRLSRERDAQLTLAALAEETGGIPLVNAASSDPLGRVQDDTSSYYWIGFSPPDPGDDQRHSVKVEVRRPGLESRFRESYLDLSVSAETTMRVESAALFGGSEGEDLRVALGEPAESGWRRVRVPLTVDVPLDAVTLVPHGGQWASRFEIRVAARDESGHLAPIPVLEVTMNVPDAPQEGGWARYETTLELRRRAHDLVISLFDPITGRSRAGVVRFDP